SAIKTGKIYVTGDGSQKRAWCYISDMVRAIELMLKKNTFGECFNIGNPRAYATMLELAKKIQKLVKGVEIIFTEGRKVEVLDRKPNIKKVKQSLGFTPAVGLDEGLKLTFDWWEKNISKF
ncbi:MAG: GDP-mannose 4,6-dehydratase, partial [Candidatus Daviesbacteria bacterium]|nr:GDP-mannose 4,6-dehydratase [Candidatus Daviesbacteria bacterium]